MRIRACLMLCVFPLLAAVPDAEAGRCKDIVSDTATANRIQLGEAEKPAFEDGEIAPFRIRLNDGTAETSPAHGDAGSAAGEASPVAKAMPLPSSAAKRLASIDEPPRLSLRERSYVELMLNQAYSLGRDNRPLGCYAWFRTAQSILNEARENEPAAHGPADTPFVP